MAGTLSKKPIPKVVVWYRSVSELEVMQKRARAMWAAARARTGEERKARLAEVLRTIATDKTTLTMAERVSAFEAGGSLITNEKFEFYRPRCRALRHRGMVKTPIPRIDPSDFE